MSKMLPSREMMMVICLFIMHAIVMKLKWMLWMLYYMRGLKLSNKKMNMAGRLFIMHAIIELQ
eukprot:15026310-Ditylum_brightwellii.AAC.1